MTYHKIQLYRREYKDMRIDTVTDFVNILIKLYWYPDEYLERKQKKDAFTRFKRYLAWGMVAIMPVQWILFLIRDGVNHPELAVGSIFVNIYAFHFIRKKFM